MISVFNGRSRSLGSEDSEEVHVQVSVALRKRLHLFKGAKLGVFMAIALHSDRFGWSKPSTRLLCKETGLDRATIFRALNELCELRVEGHRVLLRQGIRGNGGRFSANKYLIFPTKEEIGKYETLDLFPSGPEARSEEEATKSCGTESQITNTAKDRRGVLPTRCFTDAVKCDPEVDPLLKQDQPGEEEPHTQRETGANTNSRDGPQQTVCVYSKFDLETLRRYAWASYNLDQRLIAGGQKNVDGIRNPEGWAIAAHRSGAFDALVQEFMGHPGMFD